MGTVVYLTGAPATGKSTLTRGLEKCVTGLKVFCYSARLSDHVNSRVPDLGLTEESVRQQSARVITKEDVDAVDGILIDWVKSNRSDSDLIIDSHPVTKEEFGFRVTPFSHAQLLELRPEVVVCLYADPAVLHQRISEHPQGRPQLSPSEMTLHVTLQAAVAAQYAVLLGKACLLVDSDMPRAELVSEVAKRVGWCT